MEKILAPTPEQWQAHVTAWEAGGSTQEAYCKAHGLTSRNFWYWKKKLSNPPTPLPTKNTAYPTLIPVVVVDDPSPANKQESGRMPVTVSSIGISLQIDQCYRIDVMPGFDSETLRQVLGVLQE